MTRTSKSALLFSALVTASLLAACQPEASDTVAPAGAAEAVDAAPAVPPAINPDVWPAGETPFAEDAAIEARVQDLLSRMSVEEKVGQVIQADINSITPEEVGTYNLGSVLNGGNSAPGANNYAAAPEWLALADDIWAASTNTADGGLGIPALWGTDAVHGHNNIVGATIFPHNIGLGAARNPDLIRQIGEATAREVRVTGQDWTFAPTLAVVRDDRWGRTYESYSENPEIVAAYASEMIEGLQGAIGDEDFLVGEHVLATAKHFIGDGGTHRGIDQGDNRESEHDLAYIHGAGYPPAIEAGALSVMASFNSWHGEKLHGHSGLLDDVLVDRMGFHGFVVGDWNGHGQIEGCTPTDCAAALNAGVDMFMASDSWRGLHASLLRDVENGTVSHERLDEAVGRILRVKLRMGLLDDVRPSGREGSGLYEHLGSDAHRAIARQAVRESLVLLKNDDQLLPLAGSSDLLVVGVHADNIGVASGGWTINWQGEGNENSDFPNGQSILGGIVEAVAEFGGTVEHSMTAEYTARPDAAIVVFGEEPYAEFQGDRAHLDFDDESGLQALQALQADGIPTVAVFLSGRPMWMNPEINASDAFVAAWLPGSEGGGVADVLIGDDQGEMRHDFKGVLPFSWPATPHQTPLNVGDEGYDPLFAYDYGLSYAQPGETLGELDESAAVTADAGEGLSLINAGRAGSGFALSLVDAVSDRVDVSGPSSAVASGALVAQAEDRFAQEDTRRFSWTDEASLEVTPLAGPLDWSGDTLAIQFTYDVSAAPAGQVTATVGCGDGCAGAVDITQGLMIAEGKGWREAVLPLRCFAGAGADLASVSLPLSLTSDDALTMGIADIRLVVATDGMSCEF